jgi:hypothetical protein
MKETFLGRDVTTTSLKQTHLNNKFLFRSLEQSHLLEADSHTYDEIHFLWSRKCRNFSQEAAPGPNPGPVEIGTLLALICFRFYIDIILPFMPTFSKWAFSIGVSRLNYSAH